MSEYTPVQVAALEKAQPLNLEKAKALASELNKPYRSVIAKAKQLGLQYENKQPAAKRPKGVTKASLVEMISEHTELDLPSLEKANMADLQSLVDWLTNK